MARTKQAARKKSGDKAPRKAVPKSIKKIENFSWDEKTIGLLKETVSEHESKEGIIWLEVSKSFSEKMGLGVQIPSSKCKGFWDHKIANPYKADCNIGPFSLDEDEALLSSTDVEALRAISSSLNRRYKSCFKRWRILKKRKNSMNDRDKDILEGEHGPEKLRFPGINISSH